MSSDKIFKSPCFIYNRLCTNSLNSLDFRVRRLIKNQILIAQEGHGIAKEIEFKPGPRLDSIEIGGQKLAILLC